MAGIADLAQKVQAKGRGDDTHLLHVTTKELQGLQQLAAMHGGKLTRNPETGMYEAGFLEQLLPIAITAVASYFGGPIGGAVAGGITGAISNKENPLMGGALGAISGYGMGGLGNSLAEAGMSMAEAGAMDAAVNTASPFLADAGGSAIGTSFGAGPTGTEMITNMPVDSWKMIANMPVDSPNIIASAEQSPFVNAFEAASDPLGLAGRIRYMGPETTSAAANVAQSAFPSVPGYGPQTALGPTPEVSKWENIMKGVKGIPDRPAKESLQRYGLDAAMALSPLLYTNMDEANEQVENPSGVPPTGMIYPYTYAPGTRNPRWGELGQPYFLGQGYTAGTPYRAAQGGLMALAKGGGPRIVKGPGTGLSDSIPAEIQGGQKAALADGEFVVSSDVVSALGEGSTDAGARKLYAMMDRVRQQAHGSKKQIRKMNDKKVMPV